MDSMVNNYGRSTLASFAVRRTDPKTDCSHHDENFIYYTVPKNKYAGVGNIIIQNYLAGTSLTLSEHPYICRTPRLYLDLDINKHEGDAVVEDFTVFNLIIWIQGKIYERLNTFANCKAGSLLSNKKLFGCLTDQEGENCDVTMCVLLKSVTNKEKDIGTFHAIFPFLCLESFKQKNFLVSLKNKHPTAYDTIFNSMDLQVYDNPKLRGLYCDKFEENEIPFTMKRLKKRPFVFKAIIDRIRFVQPHRSRVEDEILNITDDMKLWKLTSLLFDGSSVEFCPQLNNNTITTTTVLHITEPPPTTTTLTSNQNQCEWPGKERDEISGYNINDNNFILIDDEEGEKGDREEEEIERRNIEKDKEEEGEKTSNDDFSSKSDEETMRCFQSGVSTYGNYNKHDLARCVNFAYSKLDPAVHITKTMAQNFISNYVTTYINRFYCFIESSRGHFFKKTFEKEEKFPVYTEFTEDGIRLNISAGGNIDLDYKIGTKQIILKVNAYSMWINNESRLTFSGTTFSEEDVPGKLNMWFGNEIDEIDVHRFENYSTVGEKTKKVFNSRTILHHFYKYFCDSDDTKFKWVIYWFASVLQHPFVKLGTVPIFISEEGCGKDMIINSLFKVVFGRYHITTCVDKDFVGFNSCLKNKLVMVYNEGRQIDPERQGFLKSIITDDVLRIEKKFFDQEFVNNQINFVFLANPPSNGTSIVTLGDKNRRWVVMKCNSSICNDLNYFHDLRDFLFGNKNAGFKAWANYLYRLNLNDIGYLRNIPVTRETGLIKLNRLDIVSRFVKHIIDQECFDEIRDGFGVLCDEVNNANMNLGSNGINKKEVQVDVVLPQSMLFRMFKNYSFAEGSKENILAEVFTDRVSKFGIQLKRRGATKDNKKRPYIYMFPNTVDQLKTNFEVALGIKLGEKETDEDGDSQMSEPNKKRKHHVRTGTLFDFVQHEKDNDEDDNEKDIDEIEELLR